MMVSTENLERYRGQNIAMVDGGFDPLHIGHLKYFEEAKKLGVSVFCNVQGDHYLEQAKLRPPVLPENQRAYLIDSLRTVDYVHVCKTTTADVLERLSPKYYVKGADWRDRGLPEREKAVCATRGIEVVFLETIFDSSTRLSQKYFQGIAQEGDRMNLEQFENLVLAQKAVEDKHYDVGYFHDGWREGGNDYSVETRRKIEGKNPENIKAVFEPKHVLDLGCGPGALMYLLHELGVEVHGIDFSEGAKKVSPPEIRDRIHVGSVTDYHDFGINFDLVVCRELLEHLTVVQIRQTVANIAKLTSRFAYITTRFHPSPQSLLDVTDDKKTDPSHITVLNKDFLRTLFVLEGMKRRPDLEERLDWKRYGRVLVYEKV